MRVETYTPGHSDNAADFMSKRSFESHGQFFSSYLESGHSVLDCGCGPGSVTLGIAERVFPGRVIGVDFAASQIGRASGLVRARSNLTFQVADSYSLPFDTGVFDRVFSHALIEHLADPIQVIKELYRVLKPGGVIGICSPDWGGFIVSPPSPELTSALSAYTSLQQANGGDTEAGRKLGSHLHAAGFAAVTMAARYECYLSLPIIGEYLGLQLERAGDRGAAATLRH